MDVQTLLAQVTESVTVRRVFGEPIERDGVTVVPVASVRGGAGGGSGTDEHDSGSGGGVGFRASPAGVYVLRDGDAVWRPAVDVNRIVLGGQLIALAVVLTVRGWRRRG